MCLPVMVFSQYSPPDKVALEKQGDTYGRQQQWEKAALCYKQLVKRYPRVADYHYKYGGVLGMMALENKMKAIGLTGEIKSEFEKAARLDPAHKAVRWALVELYMQLPGILGGSSKKALDHAEALEQLSQAEGWLAKGYIYEYDNKDKEAEKYYRLALRNLHSLKNVSRNVLHYRIGKLCSDYHTKLDDGLYHLQKYLRNKNSYIEIEFHIIYHTLSKIYRQKGEKAKALSWNRKALHSYPGFKEALKEKVLIEAL